MEVSDQFHVLKIYLWYLLLDRRLCGTPRPVFICGKEKVNFV
jgi:hypothetical protein